ncbi:MAG: glycosyl transferase family 2 [Gracilibacter sp. BRH_c7a]|nr:MAG: glycosyl transferase family 2 [Gracilibacter sp. BRH_c7a]
MKILIGLPAYNEEGAIRNVLRGIARFRDMSKYEIKVLVVDDGSTDQTKNILNRFDEQNGYITVITHEQNKGLGEAINTILSYALVELDNDDILVTMDADNTHSPLLIESMIEHLDSHNLDLVVASRFTQGGCEIGLRALRKFFSRGAMLFFKLFFPIKNLNDYSSGFRAYRVSIIREAQSKWGRLVTTSGFDCMAEIAAKFSRMKIRAGEIPLILRYDFKEGSSKMNVARTVKGYFSLLAKVR